MKMQTPVLSLATLRRFLGDRGGATAIEYAMIASGVGAVIAATVWNLGSALQENFYNKLSNMF